jgi:hypothetical protein
LPPTRRHARCRHLGNTSVFAFLRLSDEGPLLGLFNFTENWTTVSGEESVRKLGISAFRDLLGEGIVTLHADGLARCTLRAALAGVGYSQ